MSEATARLVEGDNSKRSFPSPTDAKNVEKLTSFTCLISDVVTLRMAAEEDVPQVDTSRLANNTSLLKRPIFHFTIKREMKRVTAASTIMTAVTSGPYVRRAVVSS